MRSNTRKRSADSNKLFPIFVKLENLKAIVIGGGKVAEEKVNAILANSPQASIRIVSNTFTPALRKLAAGNNLDLVSKSFQPEDLDGCDIVFSAVNDEKASKRIHAAARERRLLHNAADKPALCDFYLGSVVQKGNLKIGISTNGKSPTVAKRLKEILTTALPEEIDQVLNQLSLIRNSLRGDLTDKIKQLNIITSVLTARKTAKKRKKRPSR